MGFNKQAFMAAQYQSRTADIELKALSCYFDDTEKPIWTVRGQTASEIASATEAAQRNKSITNIIEAIGNSRSQIEDIKKTIGISDDTPQDIIKRLEQLVTCSVNPEIDLPCAIKLAEAYPIEFYVLTNEIVKLTGMGMDIKKPVASGNVTK